MLRLGICLWTGLGLGFRAGFRDVWEWYYVFLRGGKNVLDPNQHIELDHLLFKYQYQK